MREEVDALPETPNSDRSLLDGARHRERLKEGSKKAEQRLDAWILQPGKTATWIRLITPLAIFLTALGIAVTVLPSRATEVVVRTAVVVVIGKIAAAGASADFWFWVLLLGTADALIGLFILLNFDHLKRLPRFGYYIRGMERTGIELCERHAWLRRLSIIGIAIVVFIPIHGTGTITGSLMGRILGLGPTRTLTAVILGSYPGVILILGGTEAIVALFRAHWALAMAGGAAMIGLLVIGFWLINRKSTPT